MIVIYYAMHWSALVNASACNVNVLAALVNASACNVNVLAALLMRRLTMLMCWLHC